MKYIYIIFFIPFLCLAQNPNNWDTAWVTSFGGPSIDIGRDLKETNDKGFIIAGTTSSFGSGNTSIYIIKTDSLGHHEWSKAIGSPNNDVAYSVEISNDANYFLAGFSNWNTQNGYDGYLVKVDNLGNIMWTKNYGGTDWDFIYNSCIMPDGGLLLCGETYSDSHGGSDAYLIRTDFNGDTLWTKKIGTTGDDAFYGVEQKNNRIYVVGKTFNTVNNKSDASLYKLDFSGNILKQEFFSLSTSEDFEYKDLFICNNGEILLAGKRSTTVSEAYVLRKVDSTNLSQTNFLGGSQNFHFKCVIEGYNNDIYSLATSFGTGLGNLSASMFRFFSSFIYVHSADFGGLKNDEGYEIIKTSRGYAFIGSTNSYGNQNGSSDLNVYLVVFNKQALVNDYFILLNEFQDNLSPVNLHENVNSIQKASVYPNPFNSLFAIRFDEDNLNNKTITYQLFDNLGKLVNEENISVTDNKIIVNRNNLVSGIYTYRIKFNSNIISVGKISAE